MAGKNGCKDVCADCGAFCDLVHASKVRKVHLCGNGHEWKAAPSKSKARKLKLGDAVMLGDAKFRVRDIEGDTAHLKQSFGKRMESVLVDGLAFENKAGVWRLHAPRCTGCKAKMVHFVEETTDTWICATPKCPKFDNHVSLKCPACKTARVTTRHGLRVCLNPACQTYEGDVIGNQEEVAELEELAAAQQDAAQATLRQWENNRAKRGQGTQAAARRRREAKAKAREAAASTLAQA